MRDLCRHQCVRSPFWAGARPWRAFKHSPTHPSSVQCRSSVIRRHTLKHCSMLKNHELHDGSGKTVVCCDTRRAQGHGLVVCSSSNTRQ